MRRISSIVFMAIVVMVKAEAESDADDRTAIPPPPGWGAPHPNVNISLSGELAGAGHGWAGEGHAEDIHVSGDVSHPADLGLAASGESQLFQEGTGVQASNIDSDSASSVNAVNAAQGAESSEGLAVSAQGLDIQVGQSGWAAANGGYGSVSGANTTMQIS